MGDICLDSENWDDLCGMVKAAGIDLETLAQETRAIRRRRAVRDAETLLRLGLAYGGGFESFPSSSAPERKPSKTFARSNGNWKASETQVM